MSNNGNFLVITYIPYENYLCDFFDTKTEALNYINNDTCYFHELIEIKSYEFFDTKNRSIFS